MLGCRLCNIVVLNVPAPNEKSGDPKDSFHEELEQVFYHFSKYVMKIVSEILTLQRGVTGTARHAARSHSFVYISTS